MRIGTVTGSVWATRKASCLQGQTFLVVRAGTEELVAADQVGAGPGDRVLLATGTVASRMPATSSSLAASSLRRSSFSSRVRSSTRSITRRKAMSSGGKRMTMSATTATSFRFPASGCPG